MLVGVYTVGPFVGKLVDAKGPRIPLTIALVFLSGGYFCMRVIFNSGSGESISTLTFFLLVFCSYITGVGGNGGMSGAINSVAKSFPDQLVRFSSHF
jgi:MFS family permease